MTQNMCIDCGETISRWGKRCNSCARKHDWAIDPKRKENHSAQLTARNIANWKSPEYRAKQSARLRAQWEDPEYRAKMAAHLKYIHNDLEIRAKRSASAHAQWADPDSNIRRAFSSPEHKAKASASAISRWHDPKTRRSILEGFAKDQRRRASGPELRVKAFLYANFTDVIHQYVPDEDMSPGIYDFYIPEIDTIIEVDGRYWHDNEAGQKRDLEKEEFAQEHEYGFVRITEDQAKSSQYLRSLLKELQCI